MSPTREVTQAPIAQKSAQKIETSFRVEFRTPTACVRALDLIEKFGRDLSKRIPARGGMSSEEVNRLADDALAAWKEYAPLAKECRNYKEEK